VAVGKKTFYLFALFLLIMSLQWVWHALPSYHGEVLITSQVKGLSIIINEKVAGTTKTGETFKYQFKNETGSGSWGRQEIIFHKDVDADSEYFLQLELYISEDQVDKKEIEKIDVIAPDYDYRKNKDFKTSYERISIRTKRGVLRKKTGLIKEVKLKHNRSSVMTKDDRSLFVLSRASTNMYSQSSNESKNCEYMEVYDLESIQLRYHIELGGNEDLFTYYTSIAVNDDYVYVGTRGPVPHVMFSLKKDMFIFKDRYLLFAREYKGLSSFDTDLGKMIYEKKNLYPETSSYPEPAAPVFIYYPKVVTPLIFFCG